MQMPLFFSFLIQTKKHVSNGKRRKRICHWQCTSNHFTFSSGFLRSCLSCWRATTVQNDPPQDTDSSVELNVPQMDDLARTILVGVIVLSWRPPEHWQSWGLMCPHPNRFQVEQVFVNHWLWLTGSLLLTSNTSTIQLGNAAFLETQQEKMIIYLLHWLPQCHPVACSPKPNSLWVSIYTASSNLFLEMFLHSFV